MELKMSTYVINMQLSPNSDLPKTWLPGYSWHAFPNFTVDPTLQKGPIETPCTTVSTNPQSFKEKSRTPEKQTKKKHQKVK